MADLAAKENAQETAVNVCGMVRRGIVSTGLDLWGTKLNLQFLMCKDSILLGYAASTRLHLMTGA